MSNETAVIIVALITATPATVAAIFSYINGRNVKQIKAQVVTLNESTIGQLAAAVETRRVEAIPHEERTAQEQRHLDSS